MLLAQWPHSHVAGTLACLKTAPKLCIICVSVYFLAYQYMLLETSKHIETVQASTVYPRARGLEGDTSWTGTHTHTHLHTHTHTHAEFVCHVRTGGQIVLP